MQTLETDARVISGVGFLLAMLSTTKENPAHRYRNLGRVRNAGLGYPTRICCFLLATAAGSKGRIRSKWSPWSAGCGAWSCEPVWAYQRGA